MSPLRSKTVLFEGGEFTANVAETCDGVTGRSQAKEMAAMHTGKCRSTIFRIRRQLRQRNATNSEIPGQKKKRMGLKNRVKSEKFPLQLKHSKTGGAVGGWVVYSCTKYD